MGCLGNGITICNKAVIENGDYKIIAHIAECGRIRWRVDPAKYVPGPELLKIEHAADVQRVKWENWLDSMPASKQYCVLLERVPLNIFLYVLDMGGGITAKLNYLKQICYENAY